MRFDYQPTHLTLERLVEIVERLRDRQILIEVSYALNGGPICGPCLSTATTEIIPPAATFSALQRQQFVPHELGHMVLRNNELVLPWDYAGAHLPNLSGQLVSRVLSRSTFVDHIEAAAETLADRFAAAIRDSILKPR